MKIHRWLDFKITNRCNNYYNKCGYCNVKVDSPDCAELISLEIIRQTLIDARVLGFDTFYLLGGEPSIRKDVHLILQPISREPNINITIITNGKIENEKMYESLFDTAAARACIQISMDSFEKNNLRKSNPEKLIKLAESLKRKAIKVSTNKHICEVEIHCVISRENMTSFDELIKFFANKKIPVSLAMVCPWKLSEKPEKYNEFTYNEIRIIIDKIQKIRSGMSIDSFNKLVAEFAELNLNKDKLCSNLECGAGLTHLVINNDGNVYKCMAESFIPEKSIGNINTQRLHSILKNIDRISICPCKTECFDGFAWDRFAIGI